jgi:hypothetical protein
MQEVERFGHKFWVWEGEECAQFWDEDTPCPPTAMMITFDTIKPNEGLCWESWEQFWVEYALHVENMDDFALTERLVRYICMNDWVTPEQREQLSNILKTVWRKDQLS